MYAIVEIAGQQFKVERGNKVYVHRLEANEGEKIEFDKVFLLDNGGKISVGNPTVEGAKVAATVISHVKGDKVIIFKKKRRKGYQKWNNHRQSLTQILIQGVLAKGDKLEAELTAERVVRVQGLRRKPVETAETVATEVKAPAKKAAPKKAAAKKAAAPKKAAAKKTTTKKKED
ncbi:50S ribosomal protein L21 [Aurantibacillus circumpalustris]|uniref:50S ribosomal protein L21 n=1 Tax=Aurantibacillus circumpalustris TaxID=3036359 RepID=UPI00295BD143|nr:50S ribosomal protein L21 [Aurantibacillus circumpalustris]